MKYVSFGELSYKLIYPLAMAFFGYFTVLVHQGILYKNFNHPWFTTVVMFLGECLCGVFQLVLYCRFHLSKSRAQNENMKMNMNNDRITLIENTPDHHQTYVFGLIFILSVFDCISSLLLTIIITFNMDNSVDLTLKIILIFFTCLFSWRFLHSKIYIHHLTALGLIFIGIILVGVVNLVCEHEVINSVIAISAIVLFQLIASIQEVSEKWVMVKKFVSPYKLVCLEGAVGAGTFLILLIPFSVIPCPEFLFQIRMCNEKGAPIENPIDAVGEIINDAGLLLLMIAFLFCSTGYNSMRVITSKVYSPTHRSVADVLISAIVWIQKLIEAKNGSGYLQPQSVVLYSLGYIIIIIGTLLYNEIIIFKFYGLEQNTAVETKKRAYQDKMLTCNDNEILSQ